MALRPGRCYHELKKKAYTRVSTKKPRKSYVKGVPASKIHQFEVGKKGDYPLTLFLKSKEDVQIRSNALEAARVIVVNFLKKELGEDFFLKILVYPHHILRENPMATGAGADRFSEGMKRSFGKPIGQAARVKSGQNVLMIKVQKKSKETAKRALKKAISKLPGKYRIIG